ncbi:Baseplate structural protein Gp9/Gp10 [uncultured Caudovirales phage]|uniref:Baseplate structural protein Gp9/Gp10 n=1 Tax=uncultured Caudovirales phage TaxID=2100421 RepID=A0A6J5KL07_9CAUD|nr:Baseplate structural protein Gp9/Gp10 [uncultured Caudovirales phage]
MSIFHYPVVNITGATGATGPSGGPVGATGPGGATGPAGPTPAPAAGQGIFITTGVGGQYTIDNTGILSVTGTPNQVIVNTLNGDVTLSLPQDLGTGSDVQFGDTVVNNLTVLGNLVSTHTSTLEVTDKIVYLAHGSTLPAQADGGGIYLEGADATLLYAQSDDSWNVNKTLNAGNIVATVLYSPFIHATANVHIGLDPTLDFATALLQITSSGNDYQQVNNQNISNGTQASSDFIATSDDGDDSTYYIDLGINSSNYNNAGYTVGGAHDGYVYVNGGNLALGSQTHSSIVFHTHGTTASNIIARFTDDRLILGNLLVADDGVSRLQVVGNITVNSSDVVTFATLPEYTALPTTPVSGSTYNINASDYYVGVNYAGSVAVTLPIGTTGKNIVVKDESGAAAANPITIIPQAGDSIEGVTDGTAIMNINNMSLTFIYRAGWRII